MADKCLELVKRSTGWDVDRDVNGVVRRLLAGVPAGDAAALANTLSALEVATRSARPREVMIDEDEAREKLVLAADLIADDDSVETSSASASPTGVEIAGDDERHPRSSAPKNMLKYGHARLSAYLMAG